MATTVSRLTSTGVLQVAGSVDEYTIPTNSYSVGFNGTSQYLTIPNNAAFAFGSGNFTVEMWLYPRSNPGYTSTLWGQFNIDGYAPVFGYISSPSGVVGLAASSSNFSYDVDNVGSGAPALALNRWTHVAFVRNGNRWSIYLDGKEYVVAANASVTLYTNTTNFTIGRGSATGYYPGYISNFRIVKGTALYTADFTPPTAPLTAISGTGLLTCQNSTIIDNSTNALTITNNGAATISNVPSTFYSGLFDGSSTSLQTTTTAVTGTWTIEFWVYNTSFGGVDGKGYVFNGTTSSNANRVQIGVGSTGQFYYYHENAAAGTFTVNAGATLFSLNTWYHVAVVSNGTTLTLYINGVSVGSGTIVNTPSPGTNFYIGFLRSSGALYYHQGYISNFRYVNGTAVYTANFKPPTTQLPAIPNTSLLALQTALVTKDNSINNLTITNNGAVTATAPITFARSSILSDGTYRAFGSFDEYTMPTSSYSVSFNGTNQYLTVPANAAFSFGTGDFTVEAWVLSNPLVGNTYGKTIVDARAQTAGSYWYWGIDNNGIPTFITMITGGVTLSGPTSIVNSTWCHFAVSRQSGTLRMFINGTIVASATGNVDNISSLALTIGQNSYMAADTYWNGYMSNVRIVKGVAAYTDNFVPTAPLVAIAGTSLLTCQSPTIIDNSLNAFSITNVNTATTTYIPSKFYTASFNGSTQYLTAPANSGFSFGTGDFTIECWVWTAAYTNTYGRMIADARPTGTNGVYWNFGLDSTGKPGLNLTNGGASYTSSISVADSKWHHVAVTRQSGTIRMFVDGVSVLTPVSGAETTGSSGLRIGFNAFGTVGGFAAETLWNGYISNFRIVNGTAVYTANFTPPITQLTAVANTSLLALQASSVTKDNSVNNLTLTNIGSMTATAPPITFASSSLTSDGTLKVIGSFDEFTGNPIVDSSLMVWIDPAQDRSYVGSGTGWGDLSPNFKDYTLFNAPTFSSSTNGGVITFNGASSQYAQHATTLFNSSTFNAYTMNLWVYPTAAGNLVQVDGQTTPNTGYVYSAIEISSGGLISFGQWTGSMTTITTSQQTLNQWYNLVITYNGTTATAYVNGTSVGSSTIAWSSPGASTFFALMAPSVTAMGTTGYASGSIGTFMAYNRGLTADEVVQNYNATRKRYALPYTYSVLFNGSSQYLSLASNAAFQPGSGSFTIEAWIYPLNTSQGCIAFFGGTTSYWGIRFERNSGGGLQVLLTNDAVSWQINYTTGSVTNNVWSHVALVKNGTSVLLFLNGVQVGATQTISGSVYTGGTLNQIGVCYNTNYFNGYISNFRFINSTAVYTSKFTPPTAPLTAITNTSLLTCQSPTIIDTSTNKFTITNNGTAVVSASVTPF